MKLPSSDQTAEVLHPGKQPFRLSSAACNDAVGGHPAFCHGCPGWARSSRCHTLRAGSGRERPNRTLCPRSAFGELVEEASGQNSFHKPALGRRSAFDSDGERKTIARGDSDDLGALATILVGPIAKPPFWRSRMWHPRNASSKLSFPRSCRYLASRRNASTSLPSRTHCWKRRWQVWYGGYFEESSDHCAPLPNIHSAVPFSTARVSCHGRPAIILAPRRDAEQAPPMPTVHQSVPSGLPSRTCGDALSTSSFAQIRPQNVYEIGSRAAAPEVSTSNSVGFEASSNSKKIEDCGLQISDDGNQIV